MKERSWALTAQEKKATEREYLTTLPSTLAENYDAADDDGGVFGHCEEG